MRKHRNKPKNEEAALQRSVVQLLHYLENERRLVFFHVPNGGRRDKKEAAIMKGLGVRAGIPDLCIVSAGSVYFLELKSPKGRVRKSQSQMMQALIASGADCAVARDYEGVVRALAEWGLMSPEEARSSGVEI